MKTDLVSRGLFIRWTWGYLRGDHAQCYCDGCDNCYDGCKIEISDGNPVLQVEGWDGAPGRVFLCAPCAWEPPIQRSQSEVMALAPKGGAQTLTEVGRPIKNLRWGAPCPCGSGRSYGACHLWEAQRGSPRRSWGRVRAGAACECSLCKRPLGAGDLAVLVEILHDGHHDDAVECADCWQHVRGGLLATIRGELVPTQTAIMAHAPKGGAQSLTNLVQHVRMTPLQHRFQHRSKSEIMAHAPRGGAQTLTDLRPHLTKLYKLGLVALPLHEQYKAFQGRNHRALADDPPSLEAVLAADYSGGLAILLGNRLPGGGYLVGLDIDEGPLQFRTFDDSLYVETGTSDGKWHIYWSTKDRLVGQVNIQDENGKLVAEVKGYGITALRSYPTHPQDRPRGFSPVYFADAPISPKVTSHVLADRVRELLEWALKRPLHIEGRQPRGGTARPPAQGLIEAVLAELEARNTRLSAPDSLGNQSGFCPLHDDKRASFSINVQKGVWHCFAESLGNSLWDLSRRLGVRYSGARSSGGAGFHPEEDSPPIPPDEGEEAPDPASPKPDGPPPISLPGSRGMEVFASKKHQASGQSTELLTNRNGGSLLVNNSVKGGRKGRRAVPATMETVQNDGRDPLVAGVNQHSDRPGEFSYLLHDPPNLAPNKAVLEDMYRRALRSIIKDSDKMESRVQDLHFCGFDKAPVCEKGHVLPQRSHAACGLPFHTACMTRTAWVLGRVLLDEGPLYYTLMLGVDRDLPAEVEGPDDFWGAIHKKEMKRISDAVDKLNGWVNTKKMVLARSLSFALGKETTRYFHKVVLQVRLEEGETQEAARERIEPTLRRFFQLMADEGQTIKIWRAATISPDTAVVQLMLMAQSHLVSVQDDNASLFIEWHHVVRGQHLFQSYGALRDSYEEEKEKAEEEKEEVIICPQDNTVCRWMVIEEKDGVVRILRRPPPRIPGQAYGRRRPEPEEVN